MFEWVGGKLFVCLDVCVKICFVCLDVCVKICLCGWVYV